MLQKNNRKKLLSNMIDITVIFVKINEKLLINIGFKMKKLISLLTFLVFSFSGATFAQDEGSGGGGASGAAGGAGVSAAAVAAAVAVVAAIAVAVSDDDDTPASSTN